MNRKLKEYPDAPAMFGAVLKGARRRLNMTQEDLAGVLGISRFTVRNWETDANKPDYDTIPKLCRVLGISVQDLFGTGTEDDTFERNLLVNLRQLTPAGRQMAGRIISAMLEEELGAKNRMLKETFRIVELLPGSVAAGSGSEFETLPPEAFFIRRNERNDRADAVVRVSGRSMEPVYHDGDCLSFEYTNHVLPGEDAVAGWREGAIVKRVSPDGTLYSVNPDVPFLYDGGEEGVRIIGRVLGVVRAGDRPDPEDERPLKDLFRRELSEFSKAHGGIG